MQVKANSCEISRAGGPWDVKEQALQASRQASGPCGRDLTEKGFTYDRGTGMGPQHPKDVRSS